MDIEVERFFEEIDSHKRSDDRLKDLLDQLTFTQSCFWLDMCKREDIDLEGSVQLAQRILSRHEFLGVFATWGAWSILRGVKPLRLADVIKTNETNNQKEIS